MQLICLLIAVLCHFAAVTPREIDPSWNWNKDMTYHPNLKLIWNPKFLNPYTDPDFNDFDKSGWNAATWQHIHHPFNMLVVYKDTGEIAREFNGRMMMISRSKSYYDSGRNASVDNTYKGMVCTRTLANKKGIVILDPVRPLDGVCMGNEWHYNNPWTLIQYGHVFMRDVFYKIPVLPGEDNLRKIRFVATWEHDWSGEGLWHNTTIYPLVLEVPYLSAALNDSYEADRILLAEPLPASVVANTPFDVKLKMVNKYNETITTSFNSGLEIMTQVSFTHKWFSRIGGLWLTHTDAVLNGPDVITSVINDRVIFSRFKNGLATVTLSLQDVNPNCELNFTSKTPYMDYRRVPYMEFNPNQGSGMFTDYSIFQHGGYLTHPSSNATHIKYQHFANQPNYFRAVKIASIAVTAQTPAKLRIIPVDNWRLYRHINRPFKGPLRVEVLDVNDRRVTSGPDSELELSVSCDDQYVQFGSNSTFKVHRGVGTWTGSIATYTPTTDLHIKFSATSSAGLIQSAYSPDFRVWKDLFIINNVDSQQELDQYDAARWYLANTLSSPLHGKGEFRFSQPAAAIQDVYDNFQDEEDDALYIRDWARPDYAVVLGPSDETLTDSFIGVAQSRDMPMINYKTTNSKYSDTAKYPNFVRMRYSDEYQYTMVCNFLKSRKWDRLVVVFVIDVAIPYDLLKCARKFDITYDAVAFPTVSNDSTTLNNVTLDYFFKQISDVNIKTILSVMSGPALRYMVAEATKRGLSRANGYQWIGTEGMNKDFPYNNDGRCAGQECIEAFKGTVMFKPNYATYGFSNGNWNSFRIYFGTSISERAKGDSTYTGYPLPEDEESLLQIGLMYDATYLLLLSWVGIIDGKETWTSKKFIDNLKDVQIAMPLTGDSVTFDKNLDRTNYSAAILQIDGAPGAVGKDNVLFGKRFVYLGDDVTPYNIVKENRLKEVPITGKHMVYIDIPSSSKNALSHIVSSATMNMIHQASAGAIDQHNVTVMIPPAFYCSSGCGGEQLSPDDKNVWTNGQCISHETCSCKADPITGNPQYSGDRCETSICIGCAYGTCVSPNVCQCDTGYTDSNITNDCAVPTCFTYGCNALYGECTGGDFCKCQSGFYGKDCSQKCNCENGKCSDGNSGNGKCVCDSSYTGDTCSTHKAAIAVPALIGVCAILAFAFLIGRHYFKQLELNAQLMSTEWIAEWDNIRVRQKKNKSSVKSIMSMMSMMSGKSGKDENKEDKVVCQNQAIWNGRDVVIKLIRKDSVELSETLRWEIKEMRDIKHPNLCLFVGACIDTEHVAILNEVCGKGSLEDILSNDDIDLGWDFRYSMMKDIVRGMIYLKNTDIGSHGRLKSSNCLVDNRWTVKLADYGLKTFKSNQEGIRMFSPGEGIGVDIPVGEEMDGTDFYQLLWTAPEIIATGVSHPDHVTYGTIEGDVYSFAIIMCEMCTRQHPFHEIDHLSPDEIVQIVGRLRDEDRTLTLVECKDHEKIPMKCLRPQVNTDELPSDEKQAKLLMDLIHRCWNQDPLCRPDFTKCMADLGKISPHRGELMDNLIELMEQYTTSLESIVAERTADVMIEKEKGDLLLSKMLPPLIAEELKLGKNPQPEYFNNVSIYFSDCVGFGQICADASPYQVVELLNDLYNVMDDIIESFDCYKVETIGDCYVVASGLPVRNGDNHAGEVASMALALMTAFNGVAYKNLPGSQVQLRVGLNSGPIVAGVVGLKMPRYCLFGDTMNTASRMESGGYALKIHMSENTFKVLELLGGYQTICRGEREVKGKGIMTTHWLTGKDGTDYKLPSEDLAISASKHNFK